MTDTDGTPVTAILELQPTNKGGQILNMNIIASAYGKDNTRGLVESSGLVYIDPNKTRTKSWMQSVGLQLPSDATILGSVGSITYPNGKVKIESVPYSQYMINDSKKTDDVKEKFSLRDSVEETKDLVAFHNITESLLTDVLNRNSLLMPSLAVTNKGMTDFGDISLLFDKSTIDPNANKENKLYGADAWTPTQTRLKKNAKFDVNKAVRAVNTLKNRIGSKYVDELLSITPKQFKDAIITSYDKATNQFNNELDSMVVLYAINAKTEPQNEQKKNRSGANPQGFADETSDSLSGSKISISALLDYVNQYFPDILPEDVLKHYGYDARPDGDLGTDALYSDRDPEAIRVNKLLENENAWIAVCIVKKN